MRLGEYLIAKKIITDDQLSKALNSQLIFGAHLGTCLIELGFLGEDDLGEILADMLKVRYVPPERLEAIPPQVIALLPQSVVERRRVIPFDLKDKQLHVALIDPRNLVALDEISFVSGCRIEPWISPEVRIFQAMERYYEVPRKIRYISLATILDERNTKREPARKTKQKAMAGKAAQAAGPSPRDNAPPPAAGGRAAAWPAPERRSSMDEALARVSDELCRAENREQVVGTILDRIAKDVPRCILFSVKDGAAVVWGTRGWKAPAGQKEAVKFPLTSEPLFRLLMGEPIYRGPVRHDPRCLGFYKTLGIDPPAEVLLIPVHINDRIVALLHADCGSGKAIEGATEAFERLIRKLELALGLLVLKGKIRAA